jgi:hypothetical protein
MQCVVFLGEREYKIMQGNVSSAEEYKDSKEAIVRCGST